MLNAKKAVARVAVKLRAGRGSFFLVVIITSILSISSCGDASPSPRKFVKIWHLVWRCNGQILTDDLVCLFQ